MLRRISGALHQAQVVADQVADALPRLAAALQALADRDRHLGAALGVAVERDALALARRRSRGLATSCSRAPSASVSLGRPQLVDQQQRVRPDVALGMVVRRLRDALHREHLGQHVREQARRVEQLEAAPRGALGEDADDLVADALPGDAVDLRRRARG